MYVTPSDIFSAETLPQEAFDLVLSPHYYWVKKSDREFKNRSMAKKFASSVFEFEDSYEYDVYLNEGEMFFVAFNAQSIKQRLTDQGIDLSKIHSLYLSQGFFKTITNPIQINETESLLELEGQYIVVPTYLLEHSSTGVDLVSMSKQKRDVLNVGDLGNNNFSELKIPAIITAAFFSLWMIGSLINVNQTKNELLEKIEAVKLKYKLPQTSFQLKSLLKNLEKVDKKQQFYREVLHVLVSNKSELSSAVESISMKDKMIDVTFIKPLSGSVKQLLQKKLKPYSKVVHFSTRKTRTTMKVQR